MKNCWFLSSLINFAFGMLLSVGISQDTTPDSGNLRTWTNAQGKTIEGTLLAVERESVRLLVNGKEFAIPLSGLSAADIAFAKEWQAQVSILQPGKMSVLRSRGGIEIVGANGAVIDRIPGDDSLLSEELPDAYKKGKKAKLSGKMRQVFPGQSIRTDKDASVDLYSPSGVVIQVQAETEIRLPEPERAAQTSSLELLKGSLFLNIDAKQLKLDRKEFRLQAPTSILAVKGTHFFVEVKPGETISGVYEGMVEGTATGGQTVEIVPGLVAQFFENTVETRKMSEKERDNRKVFDAISVRKSSLAERAWGWNAFDWEVNSLLRKDGPTDKPNVSNINIKRGRNETGNLAVQFRPVEEKYKYAELHIDSVVREFGEGFLGAEFRVRANQDLPLIITTIGADRSELDKKKGGLLDKTGAEFLVQFHNLATIQMHKNQFWQNYKLEDDQVELKKGHWVTHFVPFSRNDYPKDYEVKSWFIFLCFGPEVAAKRETIDLEVAPPILVFEKEAAR